MRSLEEILNTGAVNSDESRKVREAGYEYKPCRWCKVTTYTTRGGLCRPCDAAMRSDDE